MYQLRSDEDLRRVRLAGNGLLYNDYAGHGKDAPRYNILHVATCYTLGHANMNVRKYFFHDEREARAWLAANRGAEGEGWKRCGSCLE